MSIQKLTSNLRHGGNIGTRGGRSLTGTSVRERTSILKSNIVLNLVNYILHVIVQS